MLNPKRPIYMDYHATTPLDPRVLEAMMPYLQEEFGNPSSKTHLYGWRAKEAVDINRTHVARLIGASPCEIIFTSGATESNNMAIKGIACAHRCKGNHIITSLVEHNAVLDTCAALEKIGYEVTYLTPRQDGVVDAEDLKRVLRPNTILISLMAVNNEIGTLNPIKEIGRLARAHKILFHCDAAQGIGRVDIDVKTLGIDLLSISGHKIYGPKGVGALYLNQNCKLSCSPLMHGGGHESGWRSGTLNVPGIVGLGAACTILEKEMHVENVRIRALRDLLLEKISQDVKTLKLNGSLSKRVASNLNLSFDGVDGELLMLELSPHVAVSASSACTSAQGSKSHVLSAIGCNSSEISSALRFGLGRFNNESDIDEVAKQVISAVHRSSTAPKNSSKSLKLCARRGAL